jgi:hypothetical protein
MAPHRPPRRSPHAPDLGALTGVDVINLSASGSLSFVVDPVEPAFMLRTADTFYQLVGGSSPMIMPGPRARRARASPR